MPLKMNIGGIDLMLNISSYIPCKNEHDYTWSKCDFSLHFGQQLHYELVDSELLLCAEIQSLVNELDKLLADCLTERTEFRCMEPDFLFVLNPKKDLRKDPAYTYIAPGYEIEDITLEWRIYFWCDGLTDNFLTLTLYREGIIALKDYLEHITS